MRALPPPDRQIWLLEQLGWLLETSGRKSFLTSELYTLELPSTWVGDQAACHALLEDLMARAGLSELQVSVELHDLPSELLSHAGEPSRGAPAWVAMLLDDRVTFGIERARIRDQSLLGTLCREVARVWRLTRGLTHDDPDLEELLIDLTSVYLGFGLPVLRRSWALRSAPIAVLGQHLSPAAGGYLPPQSMSFLLAVHLRARNGGRRDEREVFAQLEPNQGALLREGLDYLKGPGKGALAALEDEPDFLSQELEAPARPVERVHSRSGTRGMVVGALVGAALGLMGLAVFKAPMALALIPVCALLFSTAGWFTNRVWCSGCNARLSPDDVLCGTCGGFITGDTDKLL